MNKVNCSNVHELLANLKSDTEITLTGDVYDLSNIVMSYSPNVYFNDLDVPDGVNELTVYDLHNITINGGIGTRLVTNGYWANVISFSKCSNIVIRSLSIGHSPEFGGCTGGVLEFENCSNIHLSAVELFGCGVEGIDLRYVNFIEMINCIVTKCNERLLYLEHVNACSISNTKFINNDAVAIVMKHVDDITFTECEYRNNTPCTYGDIDSDGTPIQFVTTSTSGIVNINNLHYNDMTVSLSIDGDHSIMLDRIEIE